MRTALRVRPGRRPGGLELRHPFREGPLGTVESQKPRGVVAAGVLRPADAPQRGGQAHGLRSETPGTVEFDDRASPGPGSAGCAGAVVVEDVLKLPVDVFDRVTAEEARVTPLAAPRPRPPAAGAGRRPFADGGIAVCVPHVSGFAAGGPSAPLTRRDENVPRQVLARPPVDHLMDGRPGSGAPVAVRLLRRGTRGDALPGRRGDRRRAELLDHVPRVQHVQLIMLERTAPLLHDVRL